MVDKVKFMETLRSVAEIAKVSPEPLTKKEIDQYFIDMDLSEEQLAMVYQYLLKAETEEESEAEEDSEETSDAEYTEDGYLAYDGEEKPKKVEISAFLQMYLDDIAEIERLDEGQEEMAYQKLLAGDDSVMASISDHWLATVVELAREYEKRKINLEDLIQEGNIGVILGMNELLGTKDLVNVKEYLRDSAKKSMEAYIDELLSDDDWTSTMIAKATLIEEAKKAFAEEHVRIPTVKELADYTHISEDEIVDILNLSLDKVKEEGEAAEVQNNDSTASAADSESDNDQGAQDQIGTIQPWNDMKFE